MENLKNKTFIITGGGRGIGAEASKLIASKGANVISSRSISKSKIESEIRPFAEEVLAGLSSH